MVRIKSKSFGKFMDFMYNKTSTIVNDFTILEVMIIIVSLVLFGYAIIKTMD